MIKKKGCMPCKMFQPVIENVANINSLNFKIVQGEEMPENMRPDYYPFFYLMDGDKLLESWAGDSTKKMTRVLSRHISNFKFNE